MKYFHIFVLIFAPITLSAQSIENTPGLYYKTGGNNSDQWYQILKTEAGQYAITDIYGRGETTDFNDNRYIFNTDTSINFIGSAQTQPFKLTRVINTDTSFPLTLDQPFTPNALFAGDWNIVEQDIDPITGQAKPLFDGSLQFIDVFTLSIHNESVRFNDSNGTYFQGRSDSTDSVIFRRIENPYVESPIGNYQSIIGSFNNFPRDILGYAKFTDINHFEVLLPLQNYLETPWIQFLLKISGERVDPLPTGDVNGDRVINDADRELITSQIGMVQIKNGFNIASDLHKNGVIDHRDIQKFDSAPIESLIVSPAMTGQWYDPSHNGEGWDLQILNDQTAHLSWYTYDSTGNQMWLVGTGEISGNEIIFKQMARSETGTTFGPNFDSNQIEFKDWGTVRFYFESCNQAGMSYNSITESGHGGMRPTRLTKHAGLDCESGVITNDQISPFTGLWFDPNHTGEGWAIQVRENNQVSISWYTFNLEGNPMWMVGAGIIVEGKLTVDQLAVTNGGIFGPTFNPNQVNSELWGSLEFTLDSCHSGTINYQAVNLEFISVTLKPIRLASTNQLNCTD